MIRWSGLAPWEFESPFPGSLTSTFVLQTPNLELKKLVYLYLINYARTQPDLAIMAVNTFVTVRGGGGFL